MSLGFIDAQNAPRHCGRRASAIRRSLIGEHPGPPKMMETPRKIPYSPRPRSNRPLSLGPSAMARRAIAKSWQSVVFRRVPEVSRNPALAPLLLAAAESRLQRYPSETEVWSTLGSVGVSVSGSMAFDDWHRTYCETKHPCARGQSDWLPCWSICASPKQSFSKKRRQTM